MRERALNRSNLRATRGIVYFCLVLLLLLARTSAAQSAGADPIDLVSFASFDGRSTHVSAYMMHPIGRGPFPAIIALHGCGGLWNTRGALKPQSRGWGERFRSAGYLVLFPDSFGPRGHRNICTMRKRPVTQSERVADVHAAAEWLARQDNVDRNRIALIGWSNGGTTVLWTARRRLRSQTVEFKAAIAFYPWCRDLSSEVRDQESVPLTILMGDADDWTPAEPCRILADRWSARLVLYSGAYHGFDTPNLTPQIVTNATLSARGDGVVQVRPSINARNASIKEVMQIFADAFRNRP